MKITHPLKASAVLLALATASPAFAAVQFRIAYETSSSQYVIYMTPDSVPSPDMVLTSQVTLVVPHGTGASSFGVGSVHSSVAGITWANNSRVNAPTENPNADYLSFGLLYTATQPPTFGWVAGQEKRVFSFSSPTGCVANVALLANSDPFSQLPNSTNTNPGNEFSNVGWLSGNAYTGNYGTGVVCTPTTGTGATAGKTVHGKQADSETADKTTSPKKAGTVVKKSDDLHDMHDSASPH